MSQPWTTREERYLRDHYRNMVVAEIAAKLQRTYRSVTQHARKLGLRKRTLACECPTTGEFYTAARIADGLGVPETTVRRWIRLRWLAQHAQWTTGADLAAFLRAHPGAVDVARLDREQRRWIAALLAGSEQ